MKTIYFVRHGEAKANVDGLLAGSSTNSPLTPLGKEQARVLAASLRGERIDCVISSPLERATFTADIILRELNLQCSVLINKLFIERDFGSATNMPNIEGFAALDNGTASGVESVTAFAERAKEAIDWLCKYPHDHILVVSHAGLGQMIGTVIRHTDPKDFLTFRKLTNAGWYKLILNLPNGKNEIEIG